LPIDPALAQDAHDYRHKPKAIAATFANYARRMLKQDASVLD
jgi:L-fuculose-phosphate aldolase